MDKPKLNKLSQEIVNQIAAGEVIERPSSVVKELIDNSIDAQASKISIKIKNGGIDLIEISDNGIGIPKENINSVFDAHTTSKIKNIEDLNTLLSMGFRGEALSTITSVAKVTLLSKYLNEDLANEISYNENGKSKVKTTAKEEGTTVRVENLFFNIPARRKYLKTPQTEYRKIYELLNQYVLIHPNIHFILEKDGKTIEDIHAIPNSKAGEILDERIIKILGEKKFLKTKYDGPSIKINGYIAHPSSHVSNLSKSYIFLNNRPISDRGIIRSVYEGYARYLPFGQKVDFVLNINIDPQLVDVNVHPRKEEVRFENPYRIYSAIEESIRHTLEKELSFRNTSVEETTSRDFSSLRESFKPDTRRSDTYKETNIYTGSKNSSIQDTLLFSKELLSDTPIHTTQENQLPKMDDSGIVNIFQIFNKYIVIEFISENLWIIDQHAAAERINFEKLSKKDQIKDIQNYLVPIEISLTKEQILFLDEHKAFFKEIGIEYETKEDLIKLKTVPAEFIETDFHMIFKELFSLEEDISVLKKNFKKLKEDILATISCHSSIRSGQKLPRETMLDLYKRLLECDNPYSCPHGRPAVWRMKLSEIDNNFERTY